MNEAFESAVRWLTPICERLVSNGQIKLPSISPLEPILEFKLGIVRTRNGYQMCEEAARTLFYFADKNAGAFDLACKICSQNIMNGHDLLPPMRLFVAEVLAGKIKRPKAPKSYKTWIANQYKLTLVKRVEADFGLSMTRNDSSPEISACDAVVAAFEKAGHYTDYFSIKRLCVEKRYEQLREDWAKWTEEVAKLGQDELSLRYPTDLPI